MNHLTISLANFHIALSKPEANGLDRASRCVREAVKCIKDSIKECSLETAQKMQKSIEDAREAAKSNPELKKDKTLRLKVQRAVRALDLATAQIDKNPEYHDQKLEGECQALINALKLEEALEKAKGFMQVEPAHRIIIECCRIYKVIGCAFQPYIYHSTEKMFSLYRAVIDIYNNADIFEECCRAFNPGCSHIILLFAEQIPDPKKREELFTSLATHLLAKKRPSQAKPFIDKVQDPVKKSELLKESILQCIFSSPLSEIRSIPDPQIRYETFKAISPFIGSITPAESKTTTAEIRTRKLAHAHSIRDIDENHQIYEGITSSEGKFPLDIAEILENLPHTLSEKIDPEHRAKLIHALKNVSRYRSDLNSERINTVNAIQSGELVILPFGYYEHATTLTFYNGIMIFCDRAANGQIVVAPIDPKLITAEDLRELTIAGSLYDGNSAYQLLQSLINKLARTSEEPKFHFLQSIQISPQTAGNCEFASLEGAVLFSMALLSDHETHYELELVHQTLFSHYRLSQLDAYLGASEEIDSYLVDRCCERSLFDFWTHPLLETDSYPNIVALHQREFSHLPLYIPPSTKDEGASS